MGTSSALSGSNAASIARFIMFRNSCHRNVTLSLTRSRKQTLTNTARPKSSLVTARIAVETERISGKQDVFSGGANAPSKKWSSPLFRHRCARQDLSTATQSQKCCANHAYTPATCDVCVALRQTRSPSSLEMTPERKLDPRPSIQPNQKDVHQDLFLESSLRPAIGVTNSCTRRAASCCVQLGWISSVGDLLTTHSSHNGKVIIKCDCKLHRHKSWPCAQHLYSAPGSRRSALHEGSSHFIVDSAPLSGVDLRKTARGSVDLGLLLVESLPGTDRCSHIAGFSIQGTFSRGFSQLESSRSSMCNCAKLSCKPSSGPSSLLVSVQVHLASQGSMLRSETIP